MKLVAYSSLLFMSVFHHTHGQNQTLISLDSEPGISYSGQTINVNFDYTNQNVFMHCYNISNASIEIKFRRVIISSTASFSDQFCDNWLCYSTSGTDWITPASTTLQPGDSSIMKPQLEFTIAGTALIRYYIIDENDNPIDSVDLDINCTLSDNRIENSLKYQMFPNPANEIVNIQMDATSSQLDNTAITIYNVIGKEVFSINTNTIKSGLLSLETSEFKQGIYIVALAKGGTTIFTQRLIISH